MPFSNFNTALFSAPFSLTQSEKEAYLLPELKNLTAHHKNACPAYKKMIDLAFPGHENAQTLADLPYLPISLFKHRSLTSVAPSDVRVTVRSSGTTGTLQSQVTLDSTTAQLTSKALAATLKALLGGERLPLLIIDTPSTLKSGGDIGARAAAILGLMPFGRDPTFALDDTLHVDETALTGFLKKYDQKPFLIYGFTFLIWQALLPFCDKHKIDLSNATLLHSGGWKKLQEQSVDNTAFKTRLQKASNLGRIINFYGMAEMPGVIFCENTNGFLYPPAFADLIIRDPLTFTPLPEGQVGLVQILNPLAQSYPGHTLLTEDMGVIEGIDNGADGWMGKALRLTGRAPKAPLRGCSDVIAAGV